MNHLISCSVALNAIWAAAAAHYTHTWRRVEVGVTTRLDNLAVDVLTLCVLLLHILEVLSLKVWGFQSVWHACFCVTALILLLLRGNTSEHPLYFRPSTTAITTLYKKRLVDTWFCEDAECRPDGRDEGSWVPRKSSSSSSSMSQASLVLRANSWKLEAFLDLRLFNLGVVSLGYLQRDRDGESKQTERQTKERRI